MWDLIRDSMIWVLGAIIAAIQLWQGLKKRKPIWVIVLLSIVIIAFIGLGLDQTVSNFKTKKHYDDTLESLNTTLKNNQRSKSKDSLNRISDSTKNEEFQKELFSKFKIFRDSSNKPQLSKNYKNIFNTPKEVYIDQR